MTAEAFEAARQALAAKQPFQIYTVVLKSEVRFEIDHPKALEPQVGLMIFVGPGGTPVLFDHESVSHIILGLSVIEL